MLIVMKNAFISLTSTNMPWCLNRSGGRLCCIAAVTIPRRWLKHIWAAMHESILIESWTRQHFHVMLIIGDDNSWRRSYRRIPTTTSKLSRPPCVAQYIQATYRCEAAAILLKSRPELLSVILSFCWISTALYINGHFLHYSWKQVVLDLRWYYDYLRI